tara:strand:+ start:542 stop:904 length:363 start_codon:yes stop_codon:yes gene_type:complete
MSDKESLGEKVLGALGTFLAFILLCSFPVLWILLYGFVIFPNHPTDQMLRCHSERHYNDQTETVEYIQVCELNKTQIWTWACFAGVASAVCVGPLVLMPLCGFLEIVKAWWENKFKAPHT